MNTIMYAPASYLTPHAALYLVLRTSFELDYQNAMNLTYARQDKFHGWSSTAS